MLVKVRQTIFVFVLMFSDAADSFVYNKTLTTWNTMAIIPLFRHRNNLQFTWVLHESTYLKETKNEKHFSM